MKKFFYDGFLTVNGKRISRTDVTADNGVIHFITDVIDVFANEDCTEVLTKNGQFGTLLKAVGAAELVETLQGGKNGYPICHYAKKKIAPEKKKFASLISRKKNCIHF